jgi:dipeptidyl aminopeptidase/acylaminoacyl peptidase
MRLRTLAALTLLSATTLAQTTKRPMTFADLQAMHRVSDPQISPSGKWVLFSVTDVSLEHNTKINHLWAVPLAGGKEHQVTFSTGESNGRFAPNGQFVSFTANGPVSQIAIATWDDTTGTLGTARTLNAVSTDADGAIWSPDSRHLLFTTSVYPICSDKPTWAEEDACDKAKNDAAAASPVKAQIWDHLLYRHWNAYTGETRSHILVADFSMDGANPRDLTPRRVVDDAETPTFSLGGPLGYAWAPDSKEIAYVTNLDAVKAESTNNDIFTLKLDADPATAKKVSTSPGSDDGPAYSPDGKYLAWRSQARNGYESDKFDLVVMNRATGKILPADLALDYPAGAKFDGWIDEFVWAPDSRAIVFASALHGAEPVFTVDVDSGTRGGHPTFLQRTLDGEYGDLRLFDARRKNRDGSEVSSVVLVATKMMVSSPNAVVSLSLGSLGSQMFMVMPSKEPILQVLAEGLPLTHLNDSILSSLDPAKLEPFFFPGANNTQVEGFLIKPPNFDPTKKYPLKFLIHGGPQGAWGDAWSYRWNPELFAANGYVVVMINPRGSTGYGQKFLEQVSGDWGGRPYIDLMKGLDYAEKTFPFIDKSRECALGASYGGFMADFILTHTDRFACIVTHDGMYNPQSAFGTTEELWFNEWEFRPLASASPDAVVEQTKPAHPWDFYNLPASQDPFRKFSPMLSIQNAKTPTLVIHGQKDYRLDVSEGLQLFDALQIRGVPSKMLYFPDEGHWVLKPQNSQLWYNTVNDWCDQWTHTNKYATK